MKTSRLWLAAILTAVALMGCTDDTSPSGMKVAVQRATPGQMCWASMTPDKPDTALGLAAPCAAPMEPDPHFAGGSDLIRLVIDYGADLEFTPGTTLTTPSVTMTLDGVLTPTGGSNVPASSGKPRAFFLATFPAPAKAVAETLFEVQAAQGFSYRVPQSFRIDAPQVGVSVDGCNEGETCALTAGTGTATVNVTVPGSTAVDVTLTSTLNDVLQPLSQVVHVNLAGGTVGSPVMIGHAYPAVPITDKKDSSWQLSAQWNASTGNSPRIVLHQPIIQLALDKCPGDKLCNLTSGVDVVSVQATVPGSAPVDLILTSTIDGVLQPASSTIHAQTPGTSDTGATISGQAFIQVPTAKEGASWVLSARYGASSMTTPAIILHQPIVDISVDECSVGQVCEATGGVGSLSAQVSVPGKNPADVTLTWTIDNVLQPGSIVVHALTPVNGPNGPSVAGQAFIPVPLSKEGALLAIHAQYGAASATAAPITLHAPIPGVSVQQCAPDVPCALPGGVGNAVLDLVVPSTAVASVTLTWAIDNVLQVGSQTVQLGALMTAPSGPVAFGTAFLPVPVAHGGAAWQIFAQYAGNTASTPVITIQVPKLGVAFTCGQNCVPKAGGKVGLLVTAPVGFQIPDAVVSTSVDGVPSVVNLTIALTVIDVNAGTISGVLSLPVPSSPGGAWQIDTIVGAYKAPTILTTIGP